MTNPSVVKREHGEGAVEELNPLEDPWHEADCIEDKFHWPLPVALTLSSYANAGELFSEFESRRAESKGLAENNFKTRGRGGRDLPADAAPGDTCFAKLRSHA